MPMLTTQTRNCRSMGFRVSAVSFQRRNSKKPVRRQRMYWLHLHIIRRGVKLFCL